MENFEKYDHNPEYADNLFYQALRETTNHEKPNLPKKLDNCYYSDIQEQFKQFMRLESLTESDFYAAREQIVAYTKGNVRKNEPNRLASELDRRARIGAMGVLFIWFAWTPLLLDAGLDPLSVALCGLITIVLYISALNARREKLTNLRVVVDDHQGDILNYATELMDNYSAKHYSLP